MPDFRSRYVALTNPELFAILQQPDDYQPEAVIAATELLRDRGLSEDEWDELRAGWHEAEYQRWKKNHENPMRQGIRKAGSFAAGFNPFFREGLNRDLLMIRVSSFFVAVYSLIMEFDTLLLAGSLPLSYLLLIVGPPLFVLAGLYFFNRLQAIGWDILCFWATANLVVSIATLVRFFGMIGSSPRFGIEIRPDITVLIVSLAAFGSILYALNRTPVREAFGRSRSSQAMVMSAAVATALLILWALT